MSEVTVVYLSSLNCPDDWDEGCAFIKQWCEEHHASFYSRPAEIFLIKEAKELAIKEGKSTVLVDSLS